MFVDPATMRFFMIGVEVFTKINRSIILESSYLPADRC